MLFVFIPKKHGLLRGVFFGFFKQAHMFVEGAPADAGFLEGELACGIGFDNVGQVVGGIVGKAVANGEEADVFCICAVWWRHGDEQT